MGASQKTLVRNSRNLAHRFKPRFKPHEKLFQTVFQTIVFNAIFIDPFHRPVSHVFETRVSYLVSDVLWTLFQ